MVITHAMVAERAAGLPPGQARRLLAGSALDRIGALDPTPAAADTGDGGDTELF